MSEFIQKFVAQEVLNRRKLLLAGAAGVGATALPGILGRGHVLAATTDPAIAWSYRDRATAAWHTVVSGAEAFVESIGKPKSALVSLINEGSSEKSLSDIKLFLAQTGGNCAIACDPNDSPNARPIVEAVKEANGYVSTTWNKTDDLHPWDFGDNYVCHMAVSGVKSSEKTARILFDAMGNQGGVVHVGGIAANNPAIERKQGLLNALKDFPDIELLDAQPADWDTGKAAALMSSYLTRYGDKIKGVHCASDQMAYGVIEALLAEGIVDMPVVSYDANPEAVKLVQEGKLLATVAIDLYWTGGILAALSYHAAIGTFKPSEEPKEHREIYGSDVVITQADAQEYAAKYIDSVQEYDWNDFWSKTSGQPQ